MDRFTAEHKRTFIFITGCLLIPLILCSSLLWIGFSERNLSGLLIEKSFFPFVHTAFFLMLGWLVYMLYLISGKQKRCVRELFVMAVLISLALCITWNPDSPLIQTVHIILSYAAFVYMNVLFYRYCGFYAKERNIYLCVSFAAFMISVAAGEVSGISEVLYASCCSVLLSLMAVKNIK